MKNVNYTLKTNLVPHKRDGEPAIAIRLDQTDSTIHRIPGERIGDLQMSPDKAFITGPIADKLYAYEQLGYSPEELKKIVERHQIQKCYEAAVNSLYGAFTTPVEAYIRADIGATQALYNEWVKRNVIKDSGFGIKKVIFNDPATIVFWEDGTKTVVKATNEVFDPEKGLAMAISKRALGDKGNYFEVFKKHIPEKPKSDGVKKRSGKHPWGHKEDIK